MANTTKLTETSKVKTINNTTGSISFIGVDDRKYLIMQPNGYKMIPLNVIEGLYNDYPKMIRDGYFVFDDKRVYEYLMIEPEVYEKLIINTDVEKFLDEKTPDEIKETLEQMPNPIKENVATIAKQKGIDSKRKAKAIKDATGFEINSQDEE
jgi:hypothetical protein